MSEETSNGKNGNITYKVVVGILVVIVMATVGVWANGLSSQAQLATQELNSFSTKMDRLIELNYSMSSDMKILADQVRIAKEDIKDLQEKK